MEIHTLTYFKKVAELQHITRAAEELRVAQPSLSRTIAGLEAELGVRLFQRSGKNIRLNRSGEIVLHHTNRILRELQELREVARMEFICLHKGKSLRTITDMYCQMAGFEPSVTLECDSPETVRELICAGMGISFVPSITWRGMDTSSIVLCPLSFPSCKRYINLGWRRDGRPSPAAVLFRDFVRDYFAGLAAGG